MAKERKFYAFLGLQTSTQPRNPEYFPEFPICHDSASSQIFLANIQEITNYELYQLYLDNRITWDQYIALKNEQEILLDKKYP